MHRTDTGSGPSCAQPRIELLQEHVHQLHGPDDLPEASGHDAEGQLLHVHVRRMLQPDGCPETPGRRPERILLRKDVQRVLEHQVRSGPVCDINDQKRVLRNVPELHEFDKRFRTSRDYNGE